MFGDVVCLPFFVFVVYEDVCDNLHCVCGMCFGAMRGVWCLSL